MTTESKENMAAPFAPWLRAVAAFLYTLSVAEYCGNFVHDRHSQVDLMVIVALSIDVVGTLQITTLSRLVCSPFVVCVDFRRLSSTAVNTVGLHNRSLIS